jgi:predicted small lipoprotein YifL
MMGARNAVLYLPPEEQEGDVDTWREGEKPKKK